MGKEPGTSIASLDVSPSLELDVFTNPEASRTPSIRVFMKASLHGHDQLNHWPLVVFFSALLRKN